MIKYLMNLKSRDVGLTFFAGSEEYKFLDEMTAQDYCILQNHIKQYGIKFTIKKGEFYKITYDFTIRR